MDDIHTKNTLYRDISLMLVFACGLYLGQYIGIANTYLVRDQAMAGLNGSKISSGVNHFIPALPKMG